ncbi:MAG: DUF4405 domain-containing protein [Chlorobi bacterium]|nr:DUF4405 domain-containing protein [Chlorobiota bacterium]
MANKQTNFIYHIHPEKVPASTIRFTHTFGLGGMALVLFLLQIVTGILLKFVYEPTPDKAYDSILFMQNHLLFGHYIRNIHHLSGTLLIFVALFHLLRVFFTEAFYGPRSSNWIIGVVIFIIILFSNFTGYLLPWDQLSYWAVTVVTQMLSYIPVVGPELTSFVRGGKEVGAATLLTFFNFHTAVLPFALIILLLFHFWKVRQAGGVVVPRNRNHNGKGIIPVVPELVVRELVTGLILLAVIFLLAVFIDAPLRERANPAYSPNPAKAPWYFLGIQELIMHFHPFIGVVIIPVTLFTLLFYLPCFPFRIRNTGIWFSSSKGRKMALISALLALVIHPILIVASEYLIHFNTWFPSLLPVISGGLFPLILYSIIFLLYLFYIIRRYKPLSNEIVQAVFVYFLVTYTVLSITAIFFRGPGMALMWPWKIS